MEDLGGGIAAILETVKDQWQIIALAMVIVGLLVWALFKEASVGVKFIAFLIVTGLIVWLVSVATQGESKPTLTPKKLTREDCNKLLGQEFIECLQELQKQ